MNRNYIQNWIDSNTRVFRNIALMSLFLLSGILTNGYFVNAEETSYYDDKHQKHSHIG